MPRLMLKFPEKGSKGYFYQKKRINFLAVIFSFLVVAIIYATGLIIYHNNRSIYSVIAMVSVIPAAKALVSYLIVAPYTHEEQTAYAEIEHLTNDFPCSDILYDILLADTDRPVLAGVVLVIDGKVIMYTGSKKADEKKAESCMKRILENCSYSSVKMYTDLEKLKNYLISLSAEEEKWIMFHKQEKERKEMMQKRIVSRILIHAI